MIGLGRMGSAMAQRVADSGHQLVLWNRDSSKSAAVAGATGAVVAGSAEEAARRADVVITSLADDDAVRSVYLGDGGVVEGIRGGSIVVDTSTVDPSTILDVGEAIDETGAFFLDCPVSGSVATVQSGALTVMAGGDEDIIERVEPILDSMAQRIIRVGPRGSGAACKLAVNCLVHGINVALAESLVLAEKAGVDRPTAYEVFLSGAGGAPFVHYKQEAFLHPEEAAVAFSLDLVAKDLELISSLGDRVGAPMDHTKAAAAIIDRAIRSGMGPKDMSAIAVQMRGEEA